MGEKTKRDGNRECAVILHDIRSVHNVGSIFRTADAAGIGKIYLTGYTPAPVDRFGRARNDFTKVSLGAERSVAWEKREDPGTLIEELKNGGYCVIAVEQSPRAIDYKKIVLPQKVVIMLGNETEGVPADLLKSADFIAEIPMRGKKESLNVSVSAGIALFRLLDI